MYMMMLLMNLNLSMIFMFMKHPLSMGLILMTQTITITFITGSLNFTFWFSYILFLIMIGGMLILFIYMTSLASNEKFHWSPQLTFFMIMFNMIMITLMIYQFNHYHLPLYNSINLINMNNFNNKLLNSLKLIYNLPINSITMMLIIYLLMILIIVVKITNSNQGPLRQKF